MDDKSLIEGILAGRREDFEILVERHQKVLYAFVERLLRNPDAADEIVQATFVRAYINLSRFRGEASFKTWLHQIALNLCRARWRRIRTRQEISLDEVSEREIPTTEDPTTAQRETGLNSHIARLPPRQRNVLTMRIFSDLPFKDIARVEGITENSAKVNYHHAIARLKEWLNK